MKKALKSRKTNSPFEINWMIREIFSEAAFVSFCYELNNKYLAIEKNEI